MKRVISAVLVLILMLTLIPAFHLEAKAEETDVYTLVEQQIRAFAKTLAQSDAVNTAATALAVHGMTMNGKDLVMDESNALTAVLFNSELVQVGLAEIFADTLESMQLLDMQAVPGVQLLFGWYGSNSSYGSFILTGADEYPANLDWMQTNCVYKGKQNSYDNALEWMVGSADGYATIECIADSGTVKTYRMTVTLTDRFDFSIANTSSFKQLLSGIGMVLFREFDWRATVSFELTSSYSYDHCSHSSGSYHWIYDPESHAMTSDSSAGYSLNNAVCKDFVTQLGDPAYYYALENTVRLYHSKPWVLEYTAAKPGQITLAPIEPAAAQTYPLIQQYVNRFFRVVAKEYAMAPTENGTEDLYDAYHYVGTALWPAFLYNYQYPHTFRLENCPAPDGSNMLYLTVTRQDTNEIILDRVPLDDHQYYGGWMDDRETIGTESTWLSGQDFYINFLGNQASPFSTDTFELRIWEDGIGEEGESYIETVTVAPTCTTEGYTARVCPKCGLTEKLSVTEKLPHEYAEKVVAPSCTAEGYTSYTCKTCGDSYKTNTTEKTPHSYSNYVSNNDATCAHDGTKTGKCTMCGLKDTVTDVGSALPHTWADATCEKPQTCVICGGIGEAAFGHDLTYYKPKVPTCIRVGWDAYEKCSRCSHSTFVQLPALGHDYQNGFCTRCGDWDGTVLLGDVNVDGNIDTTDAYQIVLYYNERTELTDQQLAAADVNRDGTVDTADAYRIILYYNEIITQFP